MTARLGKAARFGTRSSALEEASSVFKTESELSLPTQMIPVDQIDMGENIRPIALQIEDLEGIRDNDPKAAIKRGELEGIQGLARNIEVHGQLQAVEVYRYGDRYILATGQRRYLAHRLAKKPLIRATIRMQRPNAPRAKQFSENVQRKDMTLHERLASVEPMLVEAGLENADLQAQQEFMVNGLGLARTTAYRYLSINRAPSSLRDAIRDGIVTNAKEAEKLASLDADELAAAIQRLIDGYSTPFIDAPESESDGVAPAAPADQGEPTATVKRARGRPTAVIKLGTVSKPNVVRGMFRDLLGETSVPDIDWNDFKAVSKAFQDMLTELEKRYE